MYEVNGEYLSAAVGYEMRYAPWIVYNHRAPTHDPPSSPVNVPSARQKRPRRAPKRRFRHVTFGPPLQAAVVEWVGHNDAQCTSCGMAILLCKTSDRGGRGFDLDIRRRRRRIAPLRFFFANWPPSRLPYTCSLAYRACGSVCTCCAAGCNRRASVGVRVKRAPG